MKKFINYETIGPTIILMIFTAKDYSSNSFLENLMEVPLWVFGCFIISNIIICIPVGILILFFERFSKTDIFYEFKNFSRKKKTLFLITTIVLLWIGLSLFITYY